MGKTNYLKMKLIHIFTYCICLSSSKHAHNVVSTFIRRRFNVVGVV